MSASVLEIPKSATQPQVPGPYPGTRMTPDYVGMVARLAYVWAWPMVNLRNRLVMFDKLPEVGLLGGIAPVAPTNHLCMLTDYVAPEERLVACPNQDVVYGFSILDLGREAVVVQVPDFGDRFWVYQAVDQRTDGFAELGKMYGSKSGFYLLVGPDWNGRAPSGIQRVFRSSTNIGVVAPRVFKDDTPEDTKAIQAVVSQILLYPVSEFTGQMKTRDWSTVPKFPSNSEGQEETKWVVPEKFAEDFAKVLDEVRPFPGEEALYGNFRAVLAAAQGDPKLKQVWDASATAAEKEIVTPLFESRNSGVPLPGNWTTQPNGARFGTDYFMRTAAAKANIFVNKPEETKYFCQDLDGDGGRLNGRNAYTVKFAKGALPPVKGFWSLTLYNKFHFFEPNDLKRYSLGTKNKTLQYGADGSLTIYVSAKPPDKDKLSNWLPAPADDFSLYVRAYWPEAAITEGKWTPPPVSKTR